MSPADTDPSVHRQLGEISGTLHALQDSIRRIEAAAQRSEDKSDASRAVVHKRMDELVGKVADLESSVSQTKDDIAGMKPITDDVRKWKLMGMGALGVVGLGGAALGVTLAGAFQNFIHFLKGS